MDLPTCPACGQSVLDEDPAECPFCGASMTGEPSAKPPATAPEAKAAPKKQAPAKPKPSADAEKKPSATAKRSAATKSSQPSEDDDDPFDVDRSAAKRAIPLRPQPEKGRRHEVVCPMCETSGYTATKAAGKEVRCANPKCLVPTFTAPKIEKKVVEEPVEEKSGMSVGMLSVISAVVVLALCGVGYFVFGTSENGETNGVVEIPRNGGDTPKEDGEKDPDGGNGRVKQTDNGNVSVDVPERLTITEMQAKSLTEMIKLSRTVTRSRKPFCRKLTAEAYAFTGDLKNSREQLNYLTNQVGRSVPYYQVMPRVVLAWMELEAGQTDAAEKSVEQAWVASAKLPKISRASLDAAAALAAILVRTGRTPDARALIERHHRDDATGQYSAVLQVAREFETFDLNAALLNPVRPWTSPQSVAVTLCLCAHGEWDRALEWASSTKGTEAHSDCLSEWAAASAAHAVRTKQAGQLQKIDEAAEQLPLAGRARLYARMAATQLEAGDRTAAEQSLSTAQSILSAVPDAKLQVVPEMKELFYFKLPDAIPLRMAILASAEIAHMESQLGQAEQAWKTLTKGLHFARAIAPSPPAIQERRDEIESFGKAAIRRQLRAVLANISSDDDARRAYNTYRKRCDDIYAAAVERFRLQTTLLSAAVGWNLADAVVVEMLSRSREEDLNRLEPFQQTPLPWVLAAYYRGEGQTEKAQEIETQFRGAKFTTDEVILQERTRELPPDEKIPGLSVQIGRLRVDGDLRSQRLAMLAGRLVDSDRTPAALELIRASGDQIFRDDTFDLIAALAVRQGHIEQAWEFIDHVEIPATDSVSLYHGLLAGIRTLKTQPAGGQATEDNDPVNTAPPSE